MLNFDVCSLYEMMKSIENDIEYNMNGYEYGFVKICQTNASCYSITKYQNITQGYQVWAVT